MGKTWCVSFIFTPNIWSFHLAPLLGAYIFFWYVDNSQWISCFPLLRVDVPKENPVLWCTCCHHISSPHECQTPGLILGKQSMACFVEWCVSTLQLFCCLFVGGIFNSNSTTGYPCWQNCWTEVWMGKLFICLSKTQYKHFLLFSFLFFFFFLVFPW